MKIERFNGINNRVPPDRFKRDEAGAMPVRDAINVDLSTAGTLQSRQGYEMIVEQSGCRSAFTVDDTGALVAVGDELHRFDGANLVKLDDLGSAFSRVAYVKTPLGVVWSDGYTTKIVKGWVSSRLLPAEPNPMPTIYVDSVGSLQAGTYNVSFAAVFPDGRRSQMSYPLTFDVPENGRIEVNIGTQPNPVQVFVTAAGGSVYYRQGQASSGVFNVAIHAAQGEPVRYEVEAEIPPARILAYRNGRIYSATGSMVYFTQPWSFLTRPLSDYIPLPDDVRLIAAVDAGLFICTATKTWFLAGEPQEATLTEVAPYGAVEGTLTELPNSTDLMWFTPRGQLRATQSGEFALLQDKEIQFPSAPLGASVFRETNGMRQHITTMAAPTETGAAVARSFMTFM
jgi:hypothetical protein